MYQRCNGVDNCGDFSDELGCRELLQPHLYGPSASTTSSTTTAASEILQPHLGTITPNNDIKVVDQLPTLFPRPSTGGSSESSEQPSPPTFPPRLPPPSLSCSSSSSFSCGDGTCVSPEDVCDAFPDCRTTGKYGYATLWDTVNAIL